MYIGEGTKRKTGDMRTGVTVNDGAVGHDIRYRTAAFARWKRFLLKQAGILIAEHAGNKTAVRNDPDLVGGGSFRKSK